MSLLPILRALALTALVVVGGASATGAQEVLLTPAATLELSERAASLAFSGDGDRMVVGGADGGLTVHDLTTGALLLEEAHGGPPVVFVAFLAGDTVVAGVDEGGDIRLYPLDGGPGGDSPPGVGDRPLRVALDRARRFLAVATESSGIELFDLQGRRRIGVIETDDELDELLHLDFDRHGRQLVALTGRGRVTAWNPSTLEPLRRVTLQGEDLYGSRSVVHAAGADGDANVLVVALEEVALPSGGLRGRARPGDLVRRDQLLVFDWHSGARITGVPISEGVVDHLAVGPGSDHAAVAHGANVALVNLRDGERSAAFSASAPVSKLVVSADDDRLAAASEDGEITVWAMEYREPATVDDLDDAETGLSGRLRIVGDDSPAIDPDSQVVLAILPFDDRTGDERLSRLVPELLTTQLANLEHLTLVERLRIEDLLEELELRREGITEARGLELGRMLNADYVLLGSIGGFGTTRTLSGRILRVETGEAVSGRQVLCEECRGPDLFEAIHLLGTAIAR